MKTRWTFLLLMTCGLNLAAISTRASDTNAIAAGRRDVKFSEMAPYSAGKEVQRRLGIRPNAVIPDYELSKEKFQIIVPEAESTNAVWGLLVWISPSESARLPSGWEAELASHKLLFVSACDSGNSRHSVDRSRLALDATCNMCRQFKIDRKRIYIGGFSGGSRIASMLSVAYADIFTGALCVSGVNFYQTIPAAKGEYYPVGYLPDSHLLPLAKKSGRFVLLTGENDMNRENTKQTWEKGFQREGFRNVLYLEVPGLKHAMPEAAVFNAALDYLDAKKDQIVPH